MICHSIWARDLTLPPSLFFFPSIPQTQNSLGIYIIHISLAIRHSEWGSDSISRHNIFHIRIKKIIIRISPHQPWQPYRPRLISLCINLLSHVLRYIIYHYILWIFLSQCQLFYSMSHFFAVNFGLMISDLSLNPNVV